MATTLKRLGNGVVTLNSKGMDLTNGYHDCDCCGVTIIDSRLCAGCLKAGCEPNSEGGYDDCQIPCCPECATEASLMNDGKWHSNCDDDCSNSGKAWAA